jgi:hypothetical protein
MSNTSINFMAHSRTNNNKMNKLLNKTQKSQKYDGGSKMKNSYQGNSSFMNEGG